ncbi:IS5 family transposase [Streptomyces sp. PCS3-D2]|uniref:IS5 family transposase n=1 Tax=Streptomyces sp. PCS3-D2 TaxID=1460244 RepID=UPI000ABD4F08|nr:IS5 family transposase [Streptomyces sp. PCS3-D2]WKV75988.1 IS5 family transposase [Streptomyces sp. PCS3-D2]
MPKRRPYPSDLSNARWELIEPVLVAWRFERRGRALDFGRPPEHDLRDIMDAILYVDRTGVQWRYLPHDFPHWNTVYGYFAKWADEGVFAQLNGLLRQLLLEKDERDAEPTACVIDAQSVKTSTSAPARSQGIDAGKKIVGRKRSIVTDMLGLLLAVLVTAASVQDSVAGTRLLDQVAAEHPAIRKLWGDGGYRRHLAERRPTRHRHGDHHPQARDQGIHPHTYGWLMLHRRLARDYEALPPRSEAIVHIAMTHLTARRLTSENTISWRDPKKPTKQLISG